MLNGSHHCGTARPQIGLEGRGSPNGCETSRLPHFLDNQLTDGGEVLILTRWQADLYTPKEIPGTHFC
jgi:hypothetical protein